jgi:hypothetical protein
MVGRIIHNAINRTIIKAILYPVFAVVALGFKATSKGVQLLQEHNEAQEKRAFREEQDKRARDPIYRARKEQEEKDALAEAVTIEFFTRLTERRCLICGGDLGLFNVLASKDSHKRCVGKEFIW